MSSENADEIVTVSAAPDGGNPQSTVAIFRIGRDCFRIAPYIELDSPAYKFRLHVRIQNHTAIAREVKLEIDWQEDRYTYLRDHLYLKAAGAGEWKRVPASTHSSGFSHVRLTVLPGISFLCQQPEYGYQDYLHFVEAASTIPGMQAERFATTEGKRELWALHYGNAGGNGKNHIVLATRHHPYESAGSFCMEGAVEWLKAARPSIKQSFEDCRITLIPMANPDGVAEGLCRLTAVDGADLSRNHPKADDATLSGLADLLRFVNPTLYCEIHNWMFKNYDGIYYLNRRKSLQFINLLNLPPAIQKKWRLNQHFYFFAEQPVGLKLFCRNRYRTRPITLEYTWFGRSEADMRILGASTLKALLQFHAENNTG